jgi:hypothetical protein
MSSSLPGADAQASAPAPPYRIRAVDPDKEGDSETAARLHARLFGEIGPVAKLGERLLQRYCYDYVLRSGLMQAAVIEVGGEPAGLAAYTGNSRELHRAAMRSHLPFLVRETLSALVQEPRLVGRLPAAARLLWERRKEKLPPQIDKFGEGVAFGVLPQFLTRHFVRRTGLRVSDLLLDYLLDDLWAQGFTQVRGVVLLSNKAAVSFFSVRATRVEPFPAAALPSIQFWLDMEPGRTERTSTMKAERRRNGKSPASF